MASLKQIIDELTSQAKENNKIASRILKIKGIKRIVVQLNAVPQDGKIRYSMTIHSQNNFRKQIGITPQDAQDLKLIAEFLEKYADFLNEYVKFTPRNNNAIQEEELDMEQQEEKEEKTREKGRKKTVEEEF
ncbi:hypothetical protein [Sulfolobus islandicus rod-shaped virus 2]|uniref:PHA01746-like domain-containing protein n=1 Tax=Sulfolobus islandicus rod-shaped virus 2 TaxID=157899 RepID=Q8V9Q1_SIRV2|nr:hypothetical protein SIRV2gp17 [Sulfolobus islandicus rod-shaped virus 2]CAC87292.1 hypothetical protein [Sulfolobus islandicus rod-shaped virus 2]